MSDRMLIVVDVQNDFCEGGALGVDGGAAVAERIAEHVRTHGADYDRILFTQDWHRGDTDNGGHFSPQPDFVDTWPVHCVAGTEGAALNSEMGQLVAELGNRAERVRKGHGVPDYSGLQGHLVGTGADNDALGADGPVLGQVIAAGQWERIDVAGLALDHCVRATALDAAGEGAPVRLLRPLSAPVDPEGAADVERELEAAGVTVVR